MEKKSFGAGAEKQKIKNYNDQTMFAAVVVVIINAAVCGKKSQRRELQKLALPCQNA